MKIAIVSGSHRQPSQSHKVAVHIQNTLQDNPACSSADIIDLANNPYPLWEESIWDDDPVWLERLAPLRQQLKETDALVIISPEWHGQVPSGLKNFMLLVNRFDVGHKPALIVTVSNGDGGAYPVAELRMSSYKNNRICYIPEQVIIRNCESVLNDDPADNNESADSYFRERIEWALNILTAYGEALKPVRDSGIIFNDKFKNGM